MTEELRDLGAVNHVLAGQAGDVGAGAADQPALDHGGAPTGPRQIPRDELARRATAQNQVLDLLDGAHCGRPCAIASDGLVIAGDLWLFPKDSGRRSPASLSLPRGARRAELSRVKLGRLIGDRFRRVAFTPDDIGLKEASSPR
jgi:hypothetical protein